MYGPYVLGVARTGSGSMEAVGSQGLPLPALGPVGPASRERTRVTGLNVIEARVGCGQAAIDAGRSKLGNISGLRQAGASLFDPEVGSGCGLPVCRGRDQTPPGALGDQVAADKGGDLLPAAVPGRTRRHRDPGVLGEHRDEGVDIVPLPGSNVALDESAQLVVA